ncbi:MAG: aldo/keto reductase [Pseudomonadales bacterium]|nr:aldo/keto reductase [Pseudomonadales bacterium]
MDYSILGHSGLKVSRVCLGTMTWGVQNDQQDANQQIDYALDRGVNFIDTAEMYAIPPAPETYGKTEAIIGNWLAANAGKRDQIILATKIAGPSVPWVREGGPITGDAVVEAVDDSLQRLQTEYIDLYQLHWPNYAFAHFGRHWPNDVRFTKTNASKATDGMHDILQGLQRCVDAGKIRYCGLSDDSPWGINQYIKLAEAHGLPRITSIQNEFNLLHHIDYKHLVETCAMEQVAYLPWSPLGGGVLSGKYLHGQRPPGSRWTMDQRMGLFREGQQVDAAIAAFKAVAEKHGLPLAQLALKWVDQVDGVTSTIIGATTMQQLSEDIDSFDISYSEELANDVTAALKQHALPF